MGALALVAGVGLWRWQRWGIVLYVFYRSLVFVVDWVWVELTLPAPSIHSGSRVIFDLIGTTLVVILLCLIVRARPAADEDAARCR